jgi:hypothetical protein
MEKINQEDLEHNCDENSTVTTTVILGIIITIKTCNICKKVNSTVSIASDN